MSASVAMNAATTAMLASSDSFSLPDEVKAFLLLVLFITAPVVLIRLLIQYVRNQDCG